MTFLPDNIPHELRSYAHFVVWRYEANGAAKPSKVPYSPRTGHRASVTDRDTWTSFDEAVNAASNAGFYNGIGYVLTSADPFTFIDLDVNPNEPPNAEQMAIYNAFPSYAERSPSTRGVHIIVRGNVPTGKRRAGIEVYSDNRFMTMTGDVVRPGPIVEHSAGLLNLWESLGGNREHAALSYPSDSQQTASDVEIIERANRATNGAKFATLYAGRWQDEYPSQSEADQALANFIGFYSKNREQIVRIFHMSALGKRSKAKRTDYLNRLVSNALDLEVPPIDLTAITRKMSAKLSAGTTNTRSEYQFRFAKAGDGVALTESLSDPWLPRRLVVGCFGRGETGKSSWAAQECANASRIVSTLWITSEEPQDHIRVRHINCGGEDGTLAVIAALPEKLDPVTRKAVSTSFNAYEHLEPAIVELKAHPQARADRPLGIVVLDAVVALVTWGKGGSSNDDAAVKRFIAFLGGIAERHSVSILMLGHLNKSKQDHLSDAVAGSASWTNSVRLAYMFVKDDFVEFQGFVRTVKSNTGTAYGAIYRTKPVYTLRTRPDGKDNVLCGVEMGDVIWGELNLREAMADDDDRYLSRLEKKRSKIQSIVDHTIDQLRSGPTTRQVIENRLGAKQSRRHWQEADRTLSESHNVVIQSTQHNVYHYSLRLQTTVQASL